MKLVIQRVSSATININNETSRSIETGLVVLIGITDGDSDLEIQYLVDKMLNLRIFSDSDDKMNLSAMDISADILIVSQFTLYGDSSKGRRPSFIKAAKPDTAIPLYKKFIEKTKTSNLNIQTGEFGADMKISLVNDGPVTLILEK